MKKEKVARSFSISSGSMLSSQPYKRMIESIQKAEKNQDRVQKK